LYAEKILFARDQVEIERYSQQHFLLESGERCGISENFV
jgi:hypothetical protein